MKKPQPRILAAFYASLNMPQGDIGSLLGVSAPTVSRWIRDAHALGLLQTETRLHADSQALLDSLAQIRNLEAEAQLKSEYHLSNAVVLATHRITGARKHARELEPIVRQAVGLAGALLFAAKPAELVEDLRRCGDRPVAAIAWGRQVSDFLGGLDCIEPRPRVSGCLVVPALGNVTRAPGDPAADDPLVGVRAQDLTREFSRLLGSEEPPLVLSVPFRLPSELMADEKARQAALAAFGQDRGYAALFDGLGGQPPLADRLDFLVMSVGSREQCRRLPGPDTEDLEGLIAELGALDVAGDVLWRWLLKSDPAHQAPPDTGVGSRSRSIIGLGLDEHLLPLADRARQGKGVGTLVLAAGEEKADICRAALRYQGRGVVNQLVCCDEIAGRLLA